MKFNWLASNYKNGLSAEQLIIGDERDMSMWAFDTSNAALLLGPMYHIVEPKERLKVLRELKGTQEYLETSRCGNYCVS